ncbi:hypothetical protein ACN27G_05995 [Plantactinospora sp. WMMB334]|uniref:hypothetical protein n=1 Tax=Plantactinospora sp. WMMB334 TaxID=3404119 RepID=UPI003B941DD8
MTLMVLKAAYLELNSVDVSGNASKIEITAEVEEKDVTTFASNGWKEVLGGIASGQLAWTAKNDTGSGELDEDMWALLGQVVTWEARVSNGSVSTSNPAFSGSVLVKNWTPIAGSVGDVNEASYTWPTSGVVSRATS